MQPNDSVTTLNHLFFYHLDHYRFDRLLSFQNRGELMVWSTERFSRSVFALRQFLLGSGLAPGDRVAVFSENRPEWHIADFALLLSRLVVVPVYNTLSPSQIALPFAAQRVPGSHYRRRQAMGNPAARYCRNWPRWRPSSAMEETPGVRHFPAPDRRRSAGI